jgi:hypothetical protein
MAVDVATAHVYRLAPLDVLTDAARLCRHLLTVAEEAEALEPIDG